MQLTTFAFLLFVFTCVVQESTAVVVVHCKEDGGPSFGPNYYNFCQQFSDPLEFSGYEVITTETLNPGDLDGAEFFVDVVISTAADCDGWTTAVIDVIDEFLSGGGKAMFVVDSSSFEDCNNLKLSVINQYITDSDIISGVTDSADTTIVAGLAPSKASLYSTPNILAEGRFVFEGDYNSFSAGPIDADSTFIGNGAFGTVGVWDESDSSTKIILIGDESMSNYFKIQAYGYDLTAQYEIYENMFVFLTDFVFAVRNNDILALYFPFCVQWDNVLILEETIEELVLQHTETDEEVVIARDIPNNGEFMWILYGTYGPNRIVARTSASTYVSKPINVVVPTLSALNTCE